VTLPQTRKSDLSANSQQTASVSEQSRATSSHWSQRESTPRPTEPPTRCNNLLSQPHESFSEQTNKNQFVTFEKNDPQLVDIWAELEAAYHDHEAP